MKNLLGLFVVLFLGAFSPSNPEKSTYYYFSISTPKQDELQKEIVLYTKIEEYTGDASFLVKKAKEWGSYISQVCENKHGCWSNLNYYKDKDVAERRLGILLKRYENPEKYILKEVPF
jgi:hypothetical protein